MSEKYVKNQTRKNSECTPPIKTFIKPQKKYRVEEHD